MGAIPDGYKPAYCFCQMKCVCYGEGCWHGLAKRKLAATLARLMPKSAPSRGYINQGYVFIEVPGTEIAWHIDIMYLNPRPHALVVTDTFICADTTEQLQRLSTPQMSSNGFCRTAEEVAEVPKGGVQHLWISKIFSLMISSKNYTSSRSTST